MKTKIFNTIGDVPREQWNHILKDNHSCTYSYEFWEVMEQSKLNDFRYNYILFYDDDDNPVALTSCYTITTDIAIFAPKKLRMVLQHIRRLFSNFFKIKMLECGTPITLNQPFVVDDEIENSVVLKALTETLFRIAKEQGHLLIVLRDFEPNAIALQSFFKKHGFYFIDSLPNTYMDIVWTSSNDYLSSMKSYYRSKLLKHLRINQKQGVRYELRDDFDDLAELLCSQWQVVHSHAAEYQREVLTPEFYREFSLKPGLHTKVLLIYRNNELVGHALLLMDNDLLRWLYFGRKEAGNDSLYIYIAHKVVETAILLGAKRIELGLTTYPIKKDLGAYMSPIKIALRSPSRLINPFVGPIHSLLNHRPEMRNKNIFKVK